MHKPKISGLFSHTLIGFGADLIIYAFSFVTSIIVARILGPSDRGAFALITSFNLYLMYLFTVGVTGSTQIQVAKKEYTLAAVHTFILLFSLGMGLVCLSVYALAQPWLSQTVLKSLDPSFAFLAVLMMPLTLYYNMANDAMIGMGEIPALNMMKLIKSVSEFLFPVLFLLVIPLGLKGAVTAWAVSMAMIVLVQAFWLFQKSGRVFEFNLKAAFASLGYGWKLYLSFLPWIGIMQVDYFLLNHFRGPREVGLYAVAYAFMFKMAIIFGALFNAAKMRIIGDSEHASKQLVRRLIRHVVLASAVMTFVLALSARWVIRWFYGEVYGPAVGALMILSVGMIAMSATNFLNIYTVGQLKKPGISAWINWSVFAAGMGGYFYMIPRYGFLGAACVTSFIPIFRMGAYLWLLGWVSGDTLRETLLFQKHDFLFWKSRLQTFYESVVMNKSAGGGE